MLDLTERFGETWCVTMTRLPPDAALQAMGAAQVMTVPDLDGMSILAAREAAPGWTLVLQLDGTAGWIGADAGVLGRLSAGGEVACSIARDANRTNALFAADGRLRGGLDAVTGRRWGAPPLVPTGRHSAETAALALHAATGVDLSAALFEGGPWSVVSAWRRGGLR